MGEFIKWTSERNGSKLICTHPLVERVWQTGGDIRKYEDDPPIFNIATHFIMKDGSRKDIFCDTIDCGKAEEYLKSINNGK